MKTCILVQVARRVPSMWQLHTQQKARPLLTMTNQRRSLQNLVARSLANRAASKSAQFYLVIWWKVNVLILSLCWLFCPGHSIVKWLFTLTRRRSMVPSESQFQLSPWRRSMGGPSESGKNVGGCMPGLVFLKTSGYVIDAAKQGCGVWTLIFWVVKLVVFGFVLCCELIVFSLWWDSSTVLCRTGSCRIYFLETVVLFCFCLNPWSVVCLAG
jgi:hypothetical protein